MTIRELQDQTNQWIKTYGVRYFNELTNMTILTEEVGELARLIARQYGEQSFKNEEDRKTVQQDMAEEIADIIFVVTCLANQMEVDLETAIAENFAKKTSRDNNRHQENPKLQ